MKKGSGHKTFYRELESSLYGSTAAQRQTWAKTILQNGIEIIELAELLKAERRIAVRFLWFLTEVGMLAPDKLFNALPFLLDYCKSQPADYQQSFVSYWLIAGIPTEQETSAINLCFEWLMAAKTNSTIKTRCIWLLQRLAKKYPDLKNELTLCILAQKDKYSQDFERRAIKILKELEAEQNDRQIS